MLGGSSGFHPFNGRLSGRFGNTLSPEDAYLSYHDVRLTREDVDMLKDDWLTDNNIAFWEEYLEHEIIPRYESSNVILLRPSMSFMLLQTPNPDTIRDALPDFSHTTHIFLPINDCTQVEVAEGGSHWSLLVVSLLDDAAFHYDSLYPSNLDEAKRATQKMGMLLRRKMRFYDMSDSPQQVNSSDCGVYVCMEMQYLLEHRLLKENNEGAVSMSLRGKNFNASAQRKLMAKKIEDFVKEGERRRS